MLEISEIDVYYGISQILHRASLHVDDGELVCILGRNGVGKTTLLRSIIGLSPPRTGRVLFDGQLLSGLPAHRIARLGVTYAPQDNQLFPDLSVAENLLLAVRRREDSEREIRRAVGFFPVLEEKLRARASSLSGGQQKFLAVARALIGSPKMILLDEPSEGIQPSVVQELAVVIRSIGEAVGCGILLVEQNRKLALAVAKRGYILDRGTVVSEGPLQVLEENGTVARYLSF